MTNKICKLRFLQEEIDRLERYMYLQENSNDFYMTKGSYHQDARQMRELRAEMAELLNAK